MRKWVSARGGVLASSNVGKIKYLLTWNCNHLVNAQLEPIAAIAGFKLSRVCTPEELREFQRMNEDPIVAEVRRIREKRASRFGYDIHKIFADLIARGNARDPSHPVVQDASKRAETAAAETSLTLKEDPPPNH